MMLLRGGSTEELSAGSLATGLDGESLSGSRRIVRPDTEQQRFGEALGGILPVDLATGLRETLPSELLATESSLTTFELPYLVIGRHPEADLQLPGSEVSSRHVYLQVLQGRIFFCDLASRTGVLQNGRRRSRGCRTRRGRIW